MYKSLLLLFVLLFQSSCCAFIFSDLPTEKPNPLWYQDNIILKHSLWAKAVKTIVVEIDYVKDCQPSTKAINSLKETFKKYCPQKKIKIVYSDEIKPQHWKALLKKEKIKMPEISKAFHNISLKQGDYHIHLISTDHFSEDWAGYFVGLSKKSALILLDQKNIKSYAVLYIRNNSAESRVLKHELGHVMGLCQNPTHTQMIHGGHCTHAWCCMYPRKFDLKFMLCHLWPSVIGSVEKDFCSDCQDDLKTYRNKN